MTSRATAILGWLALIGLLVALWLAFGEDPRKASGARGELLFPELAERMAALDRLLIVSDKSQTLLVREGESWQVENRGDYPADAPAVGALLRGMVRSVRREPKTKFPDRFDKIGLAPQDAVSVSLFAGGEQLVAFKQGIRREGALGRSLSYVLKDGDSRSWLVSSLPALDAEPASWVQRPAFRVPGARFQGFDAHLTGESLDADKARCTAVRAEEGADKGQLVGGLIGGTQAAISHANTEADQQAVPLVLNAQARQTVSGLLALSFEDVVPVAAEPVPEGAVPVFQISLHTLDGLTLDYSFFEGAGQVAEEGTGPDFLAQLTADYDAARRAEGKSGPLPSDTPLDGSAEAVEINAATRNWFFRLPAADTRRLMSVCDAFERSAGLGELLSDTE